MPDDSATAQVASITREELRTALAGDPPPALFEVLPRGFWLAAGLPMERIAR